MIKIWFTFMQIGTYMYSCLFFFVSVLKWIQLYSKFLFSISNLKLGGQALLSHQATNSLLIHAEVAFSSIIQNNL